MLEGGSDFEIALPAFELDSLARPKAISWIPRQVLPVAVESAYRSLRTIVPSVAHPSLRRPKAVFGPITVNGPLLAVLYLGRYCIAFSDNESGLSFPMYFVALVREANIPDREIPK